ncbi:MAG: hypothetical protein GC201_11885 [Alphaproteobacteria bacterium]|nr:hypothetical protein [Alphaproteobacteria bacterium]
MANWFERSTLWLAVVLAVAPVLSFTGCADRHEHLDAEARAFIEAYRAQTAAAEARDRPPGVPQIAALEVAPAPGGGEPLVTVDLHNADLQAVVAQMLGKAGVSYSAPVTIHGTTSAKFSGMPLVAALNTLINQQGLAAARHGNVYVLCLGEHCPPPADNPRLQTVRREFHLNYITADEAFKLLEGTSGGGEEDFLGEDTVSFDSGKEFGLSDVMESTVAVRAGGHSMVTRDNVLIVKFPGHNTIYMSGPAAAVEEYATVLLRADQEPPHIVIEALLVGVEKNALERVGTQLLEGGSGNVSSLSLRPGSTLGSSIVFSYLNGAQAADQLSAALDMLVSTGEAEVLARPYAATVSGRPANIEVVTDQYVTVEQAPGDSIGPVRAAVPVSAGVKLLVTPTALGNGMIQVDMKIEQSGFLAGGGVSLQVERGRASTTMVVQSGRTIVIGGLFARSRDRTKAGFPVLKDIPGLGSLFNQRESEVDHDEHIIYLTPYLWRPGMKPPVVDIKAKDIIDECRPPALCSPHEAPTGQADPGHPRADGAVPPPALSRLAPSGFPPPRE